MAEKVSATKGGRVDVLVAGEANRSQVSQASERRPGQRGVCQDGPCKRAAKLGCRVESMCLSQLLIMMATYMMYVGETTAADVDGAHMCV